MLLAECVAYFKKDKGYQRVMKEIRRKWKSYGRTAGSVILNQVTEAERDAIRRFTGKYFEGEKIRFPLTLWEKSLAESRFGEITLPELLEAYFQDNMETNKDARRREKTARDSFWQELLACFPDEAAWSGIWLRRALENKKWGYQTIISSYKAGAEAAREQVKKIGCILDSLSSLTDKPVRLAFLAANETGNPHGLDMNCSDGKLFFQALCGIFRMNPENAEERGEVYLKAGIIADTLSSFTIGAGLILYEKSGEHPAFQIMRKRQEIFQLPLETLGNLTGASAVSKRVYVIENQMIFPQIWDACKDSNASMICTSGQCRTASLLLLDMLRDDGCEIFYSGDYDPEGLLIADRLIKRGKGQVKPWHFTKDEYWQYLSLEKIKDTSLASLEKLATPELIEIGAIMKMEKRAAYQELFLHKLIDDVWNGR